MAVERHYPASTRDDDVSRRGEDMGIIDYRGEPVERHVSSEHTHHPAVAIVEGKRVGTHHHLAATFVIIGLAPMSLLLLYWHGVPLHVVVVILRSTELLAEYLALMLEAIRRELSAKLLIVIWFESYGAAHYDIVIDKETRGDNLHGVGMSEVAFYRPHHVAHGYLHLVHHILYLEALDTQFALCTMLHFSLYALLGIPILYDTGDLYEYSRQYDKNKGGSGTRALIPLPVEYLFLTDHLLCQFTIRTKHINNLVDVHLLHVLTSWTEVLTWVEVLWMLSEILAYSSCHGKT